MDIEEDWERAREMEELYLIESRRQSEEEFEAWERSNRGVAKIEVIIEGKPYDRNRQDVNKESNRNGLHILVNR
jgi:hypothetical protein